MTNRRYTVNEVLENLFLESGSDSESLQDSDDEKIIKEILFIAVAVKEFLMNQLANNSGCQTSLLQNIGEI